MDEIILKDIVDIVSGITKLPTESFYKNGRLTVKESESVFLCIYFANKYTRLEHTKLARYFRKKNHSSSIYACKKVENLYDVDKKFREIFDTIDTQLKIYLSLSNYNPINFNSIPQL